MVEKMASTEGLEEGAYASELHFAVKENDVKKVRGLLQQGNANAKVTTRDAVARTPLHWALVFGNDEAAKVLIVNTPRKFLDARDQQGCTPLHYATARAYATMARVLIDRGASIDALDAKLRTPLHYAAQQTSPEMVELLVSRGADKSLANAHGETPLAVAHKWGCLSSIPCLTSDPVTTLPVASEKQPVENSTVAGNNPVSPVSVEKPSSKKGPSLEKLLGAWKASETEARRKKEAELEAAHKANACLQEALRAWREVEQASRSQTLLEEGRASSSDACHVNFFSEGDADRRAEAHADTASSSTSGSKFVGLKGLTVETADDEDDSISAPCTPRRDLSWCTEWEAQEALPELAQVLSPRERKPTPSAVKEESHAWVQVWPPRKADGPSSSSAVKAIPTRPSIAYV